MALGLLRAGQQLQSALALGHQTFEQRSIEAVQILQRVHHSERGPHIEMKSAVSQRSKIHQQNSALGFLQRDGGVDGNAWCRRRRLWNSSR